MNQSCDAITETRYLVDGQPADVAAYLQARAALDARAGRNDTAGDVTCAYCGRTTPIEAASLWFHVTMPILPERTRPHNKWFDRLDCLVSYYEYQRGKFTREPLPPITIPVEVGGLTGEWSRHLQERMNNR